MKYRNRALGVIGCLLLTLPLGSALADSMPDIFITELQVSAGTGSQEFVELYNNTDEDIDLSDSLNTDKNTKHVWKLQYFSSAKVAAATFDWTKDSPTGTLALTGTIKAHDYFLMAAPSDKSYAPGSTEADMWYSPHFSDDGGGVQLVDIVGTSQPVIRDHVGWQKTDNTTLPADFHQTPPANGSLQRLYSEDSYKDENGLLRQFTVSGSISPREAWSPPDDPSPPIEPTPPTDNGNQTPVDVTTTDQQDTSVATETAQLQPLQLSELLPNPAPPATDDKDEFIELYNPNDEAVDLSGYKLQSGTNYSYSFTFSNQSIAAKSYEAFYDGETNVLLANSASRARLIDASGAVTSETTPYENADDGMAWALINNGWQWTTTPTPNAANVLTTPPVKTTLAATSKTTPKKATTSSSKSTPKVASSKTTKAPKSSSSPSNTSQTDPEAEQPASLHPSVLAGVGLLAVVYAAYEYRSDMANRIYQLRRYRETRRAARQELAGR